MVFGFEELTYEMPSNLVEIENLVLSTGHGKDMMDKIQSGGLRKVPVMSNEPLSELINRSVKKLIDLIPDISSKTKGIILTHSIPFLSPNQTPFLNLCFQGLGFDNVPRIGISGQPCAILHMGVQLAGFGLCNTPDHMGILVIGADQAYSPEERLFFGSAMGDVSFAGFVKKHSKRNQIIASYIHSEIIGYEGESTPEADISYFRKLNPLWIRYAIDTCLSRGNKKLEDLAYIVPHTPYTMIWDIIADLLRYPRDKILTDYISDTGHLNSNDSFVHYIRAVNEGKIKDGDLVLLINPGFGGTRGCTLMLR